MLRYLLIKNYALIQHLEMHPSGELNIITGETGAGKSIMLGAVGLLLGNRADVKVLFNEEDKCIIEGEFDLSNYNLKSVFEEEGLDYENTSIIRREIVPSGKSRAFINDTPVTLEVLKKIGSFLMDIHSQHDTLLLGSNNFQLNIIDAFANNEKLLLAFRESYQQYKKAHRLFEKLIEESSEIKKEADYNAFLLEELSKGNLVIGEQEEIEEELKKLENAEEIKLNLNNVLEHLDNSEISVNTNLYNIISYLNQITDYSDVYKNIKDRVESTLIELKDINKVIEREEALVEHDPEKINAFRERLNLIYHLQKKHKVSDLKALLNIQEELEYKAGKVLSLDEDIAKAQFDLTQAKEAMNAHADALSNARKAIFENIIGEVQVLLKDLGIPDATLRINHKNIDADAAGIDLVDFLFSANKGVIPQPLKSVASGGEFSRLMFAIKYVLADKTALPTIIFDEIDTGISGEIALKMVRMMRNMSRNHQVITISHLPQIASKGDAHYFVFKDNTSSKTVSRIRKLTGEERVKEIAKMIGGDNPSPYAYESAKELMTSN